MKKVIFLILSCCLFHASHSSMAADSSFVQGRMYAEKAFQNEQYAFSPYDKMFIVLDFADIEPGQYNLSVDWITPWGSLERQTTHNFTVDKVLPFHQVYFWFKLLKQGPLKRTFTGVQFKEEFFGEWKVQISLNGLRIGSKHFNVL